MSSLLQLARDNGWPSALARACGGAGRRMRDAMIGRKLRTRGFRAGRQPRLLGLSHMRIGANFHAADQVWVEAVLRSGDETFNPALIIGDRVWLSDRVHIGCLSSVRIGSGTLIGSNCLVSDHAHGVYRGEGEQSSPDTPPAERRLHSSGPVVIGRNVWLGDNVTVLSGAEIGDGAIIGAGSLVNGVIPPASIAVGSPARVVRRWDADRRQWLRTVD